MTVIYYLFDYNWERGELISEGPKNYKIAVPFLNEHGVMDSYPKSFPKEKCAFPGEKVAVIWEQWKGRNGRGGYRVERELYPDLRVDAENVMYQTSGPRGCTSGRITESAYGVEDEYSIRSRQMYEERIANVSKPV
jgi:hypothetical protein